jgi:hypothetical protein
LSTEKETAPVGTTAPETSLAATPMDDVIPVYVCQALGCVMPTLSADVAHSKPEIREAYRYKLVDRSRKM